MDGASSRPSVHRALFLLFIYFFWFCSLSPDSVQLPVVSIVKEVVVGGSGGSEGWTEEECMRREEDSEERVRKSWIAGNP